MRSLKQTVAIISTYLSLLHKSSVAHTEEILELAYLASLNSCIKTEIQILFKKFLKTYKRTHSVFFMPYCIQSHRIKYIEFSLQNRDVTISKPKAFFSFIFFKELISSSSPSFTDAWTGVMNRISEIARCTL